MPEIRKNQQKAIVYFTGCVHDKKSWSGVLTQYRVNVTTKLGEFDAFIGMIVPFMRPWQIDLSLVPFRSAYVSLKIF